MIDFSILPSNGVLFEQLIREILLGEGFEVHWTGVGPDQGRDLILLERTEGPLASFERKWLVSCKHYANSGKSVGINDIEGIKDACYAVGASGFLMACSTQPSSGLVTRLDELEKQTGIKMKFWDAIEIEKRLFKPHLFFLIYHFFGIDVGWKIYNANSPSFWAANYKDYFIYLSSRMEIGFPNLKDAEEIVKKLEAIDLPEEQRLRPRAIFYDNKHDQYMVFVDYLVPHKDATILTPNQVNTFLNDGEGLYSDGESCWNITWWNVELHKELVYSDHFHADHKKFYEKRIDEFRFGVPDGDLLSEKSTW